MPTTTTISRREVIWLWITNLDFFRFHLFMWMVNLLKQKNMWTLGRLVASYIWLTWINYLFRFIISTVCWTKLFFCITEFFYSVGKFKYTVGKNLLDMQFHVPRWGASSRAGLWVWSAYREISVDQDIWSVVRGRYCKRCASHRWRGRRQVFC